MLTENAVKTGDGSAVQASHWTGDHGPDGGQSQGPGFVVAWQRETPQMPDDLAARRARNGALPCEVLEAVYERVFYEQTLSKSAPARAERAKALAGLRKAQEHIESARKLDRPYPEAPTEA